MEPLQVASDLLRGALRGTAQKGEKKQDGERNMEVILCI